MSIETHFLLRNDRPVLQDLDRVVLLGSKPAPKARSSASCPARAAYMVEFSEPADALVTVPGSALTRAYPAPQ